MRFVFEHGGRTGCQDPQALVDYMQSFDWQVGRGFVVPGDLGVDLSPPSWGGGPLQEFRTAKQVNTDLASSVVALPRPDFSEAKRVVALAYWAEAEAMAVLLDTINGVPGRGNRL